MAKTACEEAADILQANEMPVISKRLRAEGRKIVRYERLIVTIRERGMIYSAVAEEIEREATRIQKERKAK